MTKANFETKAALAALNVDQEQHGVFGIAVAALDSVGAWQMYERLRLEHKRYGVCRDPKSCELAGILAAAERS